MEPTRDVPAEMFRNEHLFRAPFFQRFHLRRASQPLELTDGLRKDYLFPTLYGDVRCAIGIFLCDYDGARAALPHPSMHPVRMTRGRSLVTISCYEYRNVLNVAPYNEIAMTIPVLMNPRVSVPVAPMLLPVFKNFGFHVFHMPVTSRENTIRGNKIWGLPKVTEAVDIVEDGGDCVTTAKDDQGRPYFELRVPMQGKPQRFDVKANLYSVLNDEVLQSETCFRGTFQVVKHMGLLARKNVQPERAYLTIGDTSAGPLLKRLGIEPHPFQLRYCYSMNSAFDLPNPSYRVDAGGGGR